MNIISEISQNTDEWHKWRRAGIGASESAAILGISPYQSALELYNEKIGLSEPKIMNSYIMQLGHDFEIKARARFELDNDINVEPALVEHSEVPWLRASLDACSFENKVFAEIKYVGQKKLELIKQGILPEHHVAQLQHQFMVTGFSNAFYIAYSLTPDKKEILEYFCLPICPDKKYIEEKLFPELKKFWQRITDKNSEGLL